ncbi:MAG: DUF4136 domain-containing protein [Planctomycetes bacterium]|nr:DUF4136 domain-containing protein [Planctomycetota bacterium]
MTAPRQALFALALTLAALASSCSGNRLFTSEDPQAAFSRYTTFGFAPKLGTDEADYGSILSEFLKSAASRELLARGYRQDPAPDLLVNFHVATRERLQGSVTPIGYYGYRRYDAWHGYAGYESRVSQFTEGTLTIDLVDLRRGQLVWEGTLIGRVSDEMRRNLRATIDEAVAELFADFPHTAGTDPLPPLEGVTDARTLLPLAEQGFAVAQMNLALLYLRGEGVEKSPAEAARWMRAAALQGFAKAEARLGAMYEHGRGVPVDPIAAYFWSHLAAQQGDPSGLEQREALAQRLAPELVAEAEQRAREWRR